jgi:hypothetical protein
MDSKLVAESDNNLINFYKFAGCFIFAFNIFRHHAKRLSIIYQSNINKSRIGHSYKLAIINLRNYHFSLEVAFSNSWAAVSLK